jgi:ribonuclease HI
MHNPEFSSGAVPRVVIIHTDGACDGNPGPGGWAAVLRCSDTVKELSGGAPATTNNRMELQAAIEALRALRRPAPVELYTDSQYLRNGITEWLPNWKRRGWLTASKRPVKNVDLWRELDSLAARQTIAWHWVRGHSGDPDNERCDQLANEQIRKLRREIAPAELRRLLREFREDGGPTVPNPGRSSGRID